MGTKGFKAELSSLAGVHRRDGDKLPVARHLNVSHPLPTKLLEIHGRGHGCKPHPTGLRTRASPFRQAIRCSNKVPDSF